MLLCLLRRAVHDNGHNGRHILYNIMCCDINPNNNIISINYLFIVQYIIGLVSGYCNKMVVKLKKKNVIIVRSKLFKFNTITLQKLI